MRQLFIFITVLLSALIAKGSSDEFALVSVPFTSLRSEPRHSSELLTQAVMGMPMKILADTTPDWLTVRLADGYEGFINRSAISRRTPQELAAWQKSKRMMVSSVTLVPVFGRDSALMCRLEPGSIVETSEGVCVLPDGRRGKAEISTSLTSSYPERAILIETARQLMGAPYLWGGNTSSALDCSGLVRLCFSRFGILTPRDASQLFTSGRLRGHGEEPQIADLLFFSSRDDGPITHVAFYLGDNQYIHCSGQVKISRMDADDPDFGKRFYRGCVDWSGLEGFSPLVSHEWYF